MALYNHSLIETDYDLTNYLWSIGVSLIGLVLIGCGYLTSSVEQIEIIDLTADFEAAKNKVLGLAVDTYCQMRWTQDELIKKIGPDPETKTNFFITRIWEIIDDQLIELDKFTYIEATSLKTISYDTLGVDCDLAYVYESNYLIQYYWQNYGGESYLIPCPGSQLEIGLNTNGKWLECGPEEYTEFTYQVKNPSVEYLLSMYAGPNQNFYQNSKHAVNATNLFDIYTGQRLLEPNESIKISDPILEESVVFETFCQKA